MHLDLRRALVKTEVSEEENGGEGKPYGSHAATIDGTRLP
jgi:hypothetical protein